MIGEPTAYNITPIIDPIEVIPLIFPSNEIPRSLECSFPPNMREWIYQRDGKYSNMPEFDMDGNLLGLSQHITHPLEAHHITPQNYYITQFGQQKALTYMHSPLNGIMLDRPAHAVIHREWMNNYISEYDAMPCSYKRNATLQNYVMWQVEQGRPNWLTDYDGIFAMIATIRTVMYAEKSSTFPFRPDYLDLAMAWYTRMCNSKSAKDQEWRKIIEDIVTQDYAGL